MNRSFVPILYIRLRKRVTATPGETVTLGKIAHLMTEPDIEKKLLELPLCKPSERDGHVILIDMMQIVGRIRSLYPRLQVEHFGEPHVLIDIQAKPKPPNRVALAVVWMLLFVGSGMAIMNFHADVSMMEVHQRIYEMITGRSAEHPYWLQIPYSFGLGAGMVVFFNQLFKKRLSEEPSPLEVEMFSYQESLNHYIITEEYKKIPPPAAESDESGAARTTPAGERNDGGSS